MIKAPPNLTGEGCRNGSLTRRQLLGGTALAFVALSLPTASFADGLLGDKTEFHLFSLAITRRSDLSTVTSGRMFEILNRPNEIGPEKLGSLIALAQTNKTPEALKSAAVAAGVEAEFTRVLTAWYTGTLDTTDGPVVLAYKEALMYRPVADGMTVPTYCNKGPMWWTGLPPEISRMPVNNPRVL
jgi:hypothetical protein